MVSGHKLIVSSPFCHQLPGIDIFAMANLEGTETTQETEKSLSLLTPPRRLTPQLHREA